MKGLSVRNFSSRLTIGFRNLPGVGTRNSPYTIITPSVGFLVKFLVLNPIFVCRCNETSHYHIFSCLPYNSKRNKQTNEKRSRRRLFSPFLLLCVVPFFFLRLQVREVALVCLMYDLMKYL